MNSKLKSILITLNLIVFLLAVVWVINDSPEIEPFVVIAGQAIALLLLFFEKKLPFTKVKTISESEVNVSVPSSDEAFIDIEDIQKGSKVKIKRGDVQ